MLDRKKGLRPSHSNKKGKLGKIEKNVLAIVSFVFLGSCCRHKVLLIITIIIITRVLLSTGSEDSHKVVEWNKIAQELLNAKKTYL